MSYQPMCDYLMVAVAAISLLGLISILFSIRTIVRSLRDEADM